MDIFQDEFYTSYKPVFNDHSIASYKSAMKLLGYPYTGFNIKEGNNKKSLLFSYLE